MKTPPMLRRAAAIVGIAVVIGFALVVGVAPAASAHPLGNATVNHYDGLHLYRSHITDYAVEDVAEIPTLQRRPEIDRNGDNILSPGERRAYAAAQCDSLARSVRITMDGHRVPLSVSSSSYGERPGAIQLQIGRLVCRLRGAATLSRKATVAITDEWDGGGIGWHEITAVATGVSLRQSPFPAESVSDALLRYPNNMLSSPLDVRRGSLVVVPDAGRSTYASAERVPVAGAAVRALNDAVNVFDRLVGRTRLTLGVGLLAVVLSVALGAGHAFLPGHGKTIMAAYLVGRRGRLRDVIAVGATVTITHTVGVLALGLLLTLSAGFAPTAVMRYLGVLSGAIVAAVGVGLLVSAVRAHRGGRPGLQDSSARPGIHLPVVEISRPAIAPAGTAIAPRAEATALLDPVLDRVGEHGHSQPHEHSHPHKQRVHPHGHRHSLPHPREAHGGFSRRGLIGLGVAGGLVPSPSALLVLLAAAALGRTAFGILLVLGYGIGMAGALTAAGLLLVRLRGRLELFAGRRRFAVANRILGAAPVLTAALVLAVGVGLALRAFYGSV